MRRLGVVVVLGGLAATLAAAPAAANVAVQVVALSGTPAPGVPGAVFQRFAEPVLDASGRVSFRAVLAVGPGGVTAENAEGIWSETASGLELVARQGEPAAGAPPGAVFESLFWLLRDDTGAVSWTADLRLGPGGITEVNDRGQWIGRPGATSLVMREGDPVPEVGGIRVEVLGLPRLATGGARAFLGALDGTTTSDGQGLWVDQGAGPALVARVGEAAPGAGAGASFGALMTPSRNDTDVLFSGLLRPGAGAVTTDNDRGLWLGPPGALSLVARSGHPAPGAPPGAVFHRISVFPSLNAAGHVAFQGRLRPGAGGVTLNDEWGLWAGAPGVLALVAREGDAAPGAPPGAVFGVFYAPVINGSGRVAFQARLAVGPGGVTKSNDRGLWTNVAGALERVALEGDVPPEVPGGEFYRIPGVAALNDAGYLAFLAELRNRPVSDESASPASSVGIWRRDRDGVVRQVARTGTTLALAAGDQPVVSALELASGSGGGDGRARALASDGRLVFRAAFTDGRQAVLLPEPGPLAALLAGTLALAALNSRRR